MKRALWAVVVAVPLIVLLASGFGRDPNAVSSTLVHHPAPRFSLRSFAGPRVSTAKLHGRPAIVNFWASWCVSCKQEHDAIREAWQKYGRQIAFVGVDYFDRVGSAQSFLQQHGGGWPELEDPGGRTAVDFGVSGVPETYFIDRHGIVQYKAWGPVTPSVLKKQIRRLLG